MRHQFLAGASALALLVACTTTGPNAGQSPAPGDSTLVTRTDSIARDSAGAMNRTDSAAAVVRRTRDSILNATRAATDTAASAARTSVDSAAANARTTVDSIAGNLKTSFPVRSAAGRELGTLTVTEVAQTLSFSGTLRGLPPGVHGVHVHSAARCDAPAFTSAGDHWNPTSKQHGTENPQGPHVGDMSNITVGADSSASVLVVTRGGTLRGGSNALLDTDGASFVVHVTADDYRSDPSGNSGDRIACGAIGGK
ncbi:MAG: superoxide dismutase family protein [Gemmatimonadota bacterium]